MRRQHGSIKWFLVLMVIFGLAILLIPFIVTSPAYLYLELTDSVFKKSNLIGQKGNIVNDNGSISIPFIIQNMSGKNIIYIRKIKSGNSRWIVKVDGYDPVSIEVNIPPMKKGIYLILLRPNYGQLNVNAINAVKPDETITSIQKITVNGKAISNTLKGNVITRLSPGHYKIHVEAAGFYPGDVDVIVEKGKQKEVAVVLSPLLTDNEAARIILRWDVNPRDLDSHLYLPKTAGLLNRHIYYPPFFMKAMYNGSQAAVLDVDDVTSYGPETITINKTLNGIYEYAVYHYAGEGSIGSTSKAEVTVITHEKIQKFSAPTGCTNKWWHVMSLNIKDLSVTVTPINDCPVSMGWKVGEKDSQ